MIRAFFSGMALFLATVAHAQPFTGDLAISELIVSPSPADSGEDVHVNFFVRNLGPGSAQMTGYEIRVDGDLVRSSSSTRTFSTQGLEVSFSETVTMPEVDFEETVTVEVTIFDNMNSVNNEDSVTVRVIPVTEPDLTPDTPSGWSGPIVVADVRGTTQTQAVVASGRTLYVDFAFRNDGAAIVSAPVRVVMLLDGLQVFADTYPPLGEGERRQVRDVVALGTPSIGVHTLEIILDEDRTIDEFDETNNSTSISFRVEDGAISDLEFALSSGSDWPTAAFLSDAVGSRTALTRFDAGDTVYANLSIRNAGASDTPEFSIDVQLDGIVIDTIRQAGIPAGSIVTVTNRVIIDQAIEGGTVEFILDAAGEVAESDEADNDISITFAVGGCAADFNGDGFVDFFDYADYVESFEAGTFDADVNGDGFVDFFDYTVFVGDFESGGC